MKVPARAPSLDELWGDLSTDSEQATNALLKAMRHPLDRYRHWDSLRHLTPPEGVTHRQWWMAVKVARSASLHPLPLTDSDGKHFSYSVPDQATELLQKIDQLGGGTLGVPHAVVNPATREQYLVRSLIEESITSSQLEGATTSRKVAKELLRSGRDPRTKSERMIVNNYMAMNTVRDWADRAITPADVLELQRIVTEGTLENPDSAGRLQLPEEDRVAVFDRQSSRLLHRPPPADQLPDRLIALCDFANGQEIGKFLHPVIRAILVHLWLAYDHPFEDGNGRTARALFYWSMLRSRYWITEFLSISRILAQAPGQYGMSFLLTETDDLDATYFVLYQLEVIVRAIKDLDAFVERKARELRESRQLVAKARLNHRQADLIRHALTHPDAYYTFAGHARSHGVVYQSARTDLLGLEARGFLDRTMVGQTIHFWPVSDLSDRLSTATRPDRLPAGQRTIWPKARA